MPRNGSSSTRQASRRQASRKTPVAGDMFVASTKTNVACGKRGRSKDAELEDHVNNNVKRIASWGAQNELRIVEGKCDKTLWKCSKCDDSHLLSEMLKCKESSCGFAAHPDCIGLEKSVLEIIGNNYTCFKCKKCPNCNASMYDHRIKGGCIYCDGCDRMFHMACHVPPVDGHSIECREGKFLIPASGNKVWHCSDCNKRTQLLNPSSDVRDFLLNFIGSKNDVHVNKPVKNDSPPNKTLSDNVPHGVFQFAQPLPLPPLPARSKKPPKPTAAVSKPQTEIRTIVKRTAKKPSAGTTAWTNFRSPNGIKLKADRPPTTNALRQALSLWTSQMCASYFQHKLPGSDQIILENKLYGSSLLMLTRDQCMSLFNLPVGIAVKFHHSICEWRGKWF